MKSKLKLLITIMLKFTSIVIYQFMCFLVVCQKKRVVFMTPRHTDLKDNLYYLFQEMQVAHPDLEYILLTSSKKKFLKPFRQMIKEYYYLASSTTFILDDYYLPLYFIRVRKETTVVQLWHASGPLKRVGYSLKGYPEGPNEGYLKVVPIHSNYDKVIVNSACEIDYYSEAFNMEKSKVLPLGSPRTDILFKNVGNTKQKEAFLNKHPQFINKELILCAPTFRGKSTSTNQYLPHFDVEKLTPKLLKENKVLIFNLHPYMHKNESYMKTTDNNAVFWNQGEYTIEELLMIADALISDYSSVIYDFAILEKPIAMYCYDYEKYNAQRGFYLDIKKLLPTSYFESESALFEWILQDTKNRAEVKALKERNFKYQDGLASKRIVNEIFPEEKIISRENIPRNIEISE